MSRLPAQSIWRSTHNGDRFGEIVDARNIDLSEDGKAKLARKAMTLFSYGETEDPTAGTGAAFQGTVLGIVSDTEYAYILTAAGMYVMHLTDSLLPALETPNNGSQPTFGFDGDLVMYQGLPHASGGAYVSSLSLGFSNWSARVISSGLSTTVPHPLCVLEQLNQLAVGNGNTVKTYDTSYSNQATLTLPSEYIVTAIRWRQNNLYIGTRHKFGGEAKLFIWNGTGSAAQYGFGCGADWIYSLCEYGGSIVIVTSAGQIRRFNGGGFSQSEDVNFPVYHTPFSWSSSNDSEYLVGRVANRGMAADGGFLYINIDGALNNSEGAYPGSYLPTQPSGLWQYSQTSGLWPVAGLNFASRLRLTPSAVNSGYLSFSQAHQAQTGDAVMAAPVGLTGLTGGQVYYAIPGSTTTMRLALSPADAEEGRYVAIGGTISTDTFVLDRYETISYGTVSYPGAVFTLGAGRPSTFYAANVLFGGGLYDSSLALHRASLCGLGMGRNRGSFTTPKLMSDTAADTFSRMAAFVENMALDTDQVLLKYRSEKRPGLPSPLAYSGTGATWTSSTTFTVDTTLKDVKNIQVGDEITVIKGAGAGYTCHVTFIENSTSTYTFTVDETMPVSSGTFDFTADNWTKLGTFSRDNLTALRTGFQTALERLQGKWAQFKLELRGREISIEEMLITNTPKQ